MSVVACIVLVGGIPGSGKSTLIDCLVRNLSNYFISNGDSSNEKKAVIFSQNDKSNNPNRFYEIIPISFDEFYTVQEQEQLVNVPNGWKDFRKDFLDGVEHYICFLCHRKYELSSISLRSKAIFNCLADKYSSYGDSKKKLILVVEDNFYYSSMRYKWYQVCRKYELGFCQVFLHCPLKLALQRNNARVTKVPENVIHTMSGKLELPDPQRNPWEKLSYVYHAAEDHKTVSIDKLVQLIKVAADNPPEPVIDISEQKRETQMKCSQNVIHQIDKILRRLTGTAVKRLLAGSRSKDDLKILTSKIIHARQKLLKELSEGSICLPVNVTEAISNNKIQNAGVGAEKYLNILLEKEIDEVLRS